MSILERFVERYNVHFKKFPRNAFENPFDKQDMEIKLVAWSLLDLIEELENKWNKQSSPDSSGSNGDAKV